MSSLRTVGRSCHLRRPCRGTTGLTAVYVGAYAATYLAMITPMAISLALKIQQIDPTNKETSLGVVIGVAAMFAIVGNPVAGLLSDHTRSRLGMRRPWLIGGVLVALLGLWIVAAASTVPMVLAGWCLAQLAFSAVNAAMTAVLPDQYPAERRGRVSGLINLGQAAGIPVGLALAQALNGSLVAVFLVPGAIGVAAVLLLALVLPDRRNAHGERAPLDLAGLLRGFVIDSRRHSDFAWAWAGRFLIMLAFSFINTYTVYFLSNRFGFGPDEVAGRAATSAAIGTVVIGVSSVLGGFLSDRLGRRKIFIAASSVLFGASVLVFPFVPNFTGYLVAAVVNSFAVGMFFAVDLALVTDVLPSKETDAAKGMGIFAIANKLPESVAPMTAPLLLAIGGGQNYVALFGAAAVIGMLGALTMRPIRGVR